jgi:hypothetical protein
MIQTPSNTRPILNQTNRKNRVQVFSIKIYSPEKKK